MKCRICGNASDNPVFGVREMLMGTRERFAYFQCSQCGCLQIDDYPANLADYYPDDYYSFEQGERQPQGIDRRLKDTRDRWILFNPGLVGRLCAALKPTGDIAKLRGLGLDLDARILDVGCGAGHFLTRLHQLGFRDLTGIDPYLDRDRQPVPRLRLLKTDLASLSGTYDLIRLNHSLEHMPRQAEQLAGIAAHLKPGGCCLISVPLVTSHAWDHYGTDWVQLDAPRHLYLHSEASLKRLASAAGLALLRVIHDSTAFQFWGSELYRQDIALREARQTGRRPVSRKMLRRYKQQAARLNREQRGDAATFCFRKVAAAPASTPQATPPPKPSSAGNPPA
ncbi:class I SAM-dependent methyltransferase [Methyloparacoccus murrellii]